MAKFVPDIETKRWVIIAPARAKRPDQTKNQANVVPAGRQVCVFCPGNENLTPPEIYRIGEGEPAKPGWKVRVVPNKYPITDFHEVIIHSPNDSADIEDLTKNHVELILQTYKLRFNAHSQHGHVLIFNNHGPTSGASILHPHSQVLVVPKQIVLDSLHLEPVNNLISEDNYFTVYVPDFSQWPFEVWIAPKRKGGMFGDILDDEIKNLAKILQKILKKLTTKFENLSYNYYIHHGADWYLRIIPRTIQRGGFELGTGLSVNTTDPAEVAKELTGETV